MQPTLLFKSSKQSRFWLSTSEQGQNLSTSYAYLFPQMEEIELFEDETDYSLQQKVQTLNFKENQKLIFTGVRPHPSKILRSLKNTNVSTFIFHIYGNFIVNIEKWLSLSPMLQDKKVLFLTASERQQEMVTSFMKDRSCVRTFPMPFPSKQWSFSNTIREEFRKSLKIASNDTAFIYSGRISLQKNTQLLLKFLRKSLTAFPAKKFHLLVMGFVDDLQHPFMNIELPEGYNFSLWQHYVDELRDFPNLKIHMLNHCRKEERHGYFCAADLFLSLSLHHTEAFGLGPLEALCNGLPAILSDWGGYASFAKHSDQCRLVPTRMRNKSPEISYAHFKNYLNDFLKNHSLDENRLLQGKIYQDAYTHERFHDFWQTLSNETLPCFQGFHEKALEKSQKIYQGFAKDSSNDYQEIFNNYCQTNMASNK